MALTGCGGQDEGADTTRGAITSEVCECDPDMPETCTCTIWTCETVPDQFRNKVRCTAAPPDGGGQTGDYTCPEGGGFDASCPGSDAPGNGDWQCTATEDQLVCEREGESDGGGSAGDGAGGGAGDGAGGASGGDGAAGSGGDEWSGCTRTQGYWKNHPEAWAVTSLELGGVVYEQAELLTIFRTEVEGDASLNLAHQLIAALLNGAAGTSVPDAVSTAVSQAQDWLAAHADADGRLAFGVHSDTEAGQEAVRIAGILDEYNNGLSGPEHCE